MATMVTVAIYHDLADAMVARSCLEAYGLVAVLPEWNHATIAWHFVFALHGLRLWTIDSSAEVAQQLLGYVADPEHATVTMKQTSSWLFADIAIVDLATAAAAFVLAGLPMPVWKRRMRRA
jgi:hypothetical protein